MREPETLDLILLEKPGMLWLYRLVQLFERDLEFTQFRTIVRSPIHIGERQTFARITATLRIF